MDPSTLYSELHRDAADTISMLSREINFVQKHIEKVDNSRENEMQEFEEKKRKLKEAAGSGMPAALLEQKIIAMMKNHTDLLEEISKLTAEAMKEKNIDLINETVTLMDRQISRIQADHDKNVLELREKRERINNKLTSIQEVDRMIVDLEGKIRTDIEHFNKDIEEAHFTKQQLYKRDDVDSIAVQSQIRDVDLRIAELSKKHQHDIDFMQKQMKDIDMESVALFKNQSATMKDLFVGTKEDCLEEIKRLEKLKLNATPSRQSALNRAIASYQSRITEEEDKQRKGLFMDSTKDYTEEIKRLEALKLISSISQQSALDRAIASYQSRKATEEANQKIRNSLVGKGTEEISKEIKRLEELKLNSSASQQSALDRAIASYQSRINEEMGQNKRKSGFLDASTEELAKEIKRLEELKLNSSPSKQSALDRAIASYRARVTDAEVKQNLAITDGINEFLKKHGLFMSENGEIRDASGKLMTRAMAHENGLLDALDKYLVDSYGFHLTDLAKMLTQDGKVLTKEQAQKLAMLQKLDPAGMRLPDESIRSDLSSRDSDLPSEDALYLKKYLGLPLTLALAEITAKQPRDPIHYLGHWLLKYRYNQEVEQVQKLEVEQLTNIRSKLAKELWEKFVAEEARNTVLEVVQRAEIEGDQNEFNRELQRIADETEAMEHEEDQDALEEEARDTLGELGPTVNQRGAARTSN